MSHSRDHEDVSTDPDGTAEFQTDKLPQDETENLDVADNDATTDLRSPSHDNSDATQHFDTEPIGDNASGGDQTAAFISDTEKLSNASAELDTEALGTAAFVPDTAPLPPDATGDWQEADASKGNQTADFPREKAPETAERRRSSQTGGTADASFSVDMAPQAGRYALKKFHARGGMGEIWLAQDPDIGRDVALKKIRQGQEHQKEFFLLEARITGQLEHPGVVPVHELGLDETGQPFYTMKFVHGRTLRHAIDEYHSTRSGEENYV